MKSQHSKSFYDTRYAEYKKRVKASGGFILNRNSFESAYEALQGTTKNVMKDLVYSAKYGTNYKTALAEFRALKSVGIKSSFKDLKLMTTQDFADIYVAELNKGYRDLRAQGITGKDAATIISQQWFGSK